MCIFCSTFAAAFVKGSASDKERRRIAHSAGKDGWVAETNSLLNCRTGNCTGGSNPPPSAEKNLQGIIYQPCRFFLYPQKCTKNAPHPISMHFFGYFFYLINCYLSALYTVKCVGVFKIPYIPHFLSNYLTLSNSTKCTVHFFCHFILKNARKKELPL